MQAEIVQDSRRCIQFLIRFLQLDGPIRSTNTLEERRNRQDLIEVYKMYKKLDTGELFAKDLNVKDTRGHSIKLEKLGCARDVSISSHTHSALECNGSTQGGCAKYQCL